MLLNFFIEQFKLQLSKIFKAHNGNFLCATVTFTVLTLVSRSVIINDHVTTIRYTYIAAIAADRARTLKPSYAFSERLAENIYGPAARWRTVSPRWSKFMFDLGPHIKAAGRLNLQKIVRSETRKETVFDQ